MYYVLLSNTFLYYEYIKFWYIYTTTYTADTDSLFLYEYKRKSQCTNGQWIKFN